MQKLKNKIAEGNYNNNHHEIKGAIDDDSFMIARWTIIKEIINKNINEVIHSILSLYDLVTSSR